MPDIDRAYSWAIQCCNLPNVGYSQAYRNAKRVNGITYYDCSSFINYALLAGGWETPQYAPAHNPFTTYTEPNVLLSLGFREVPANGIYMAGDIGWKTGHTEMCYQGGNGNGIFMGAHTSNATLANQVSIGSSKGDPNYRRSFTRLFRYGDSPAQDVTPSIYVVSAMCGNFWQESGINPAMWEGNNTPGDYPWDMHILGRGFGIGQWTNVMGDANGRLWHMGIWVEARAPYYQFDGTNQILYILEEKYWVPKPEYPEFRSLNDFLTSQSTDLARLTHAWNLCWEGIRDSSWDARVGYAQQCYDYIIDNLDKPDMFGGMYFGQRYLTVPERLNNAMWVYLVLNGYAGGTDTLPKKGLKAWEMLRPAQYYRR